MRALDRKLLRDLRDIWGQALAICLVIASGVAMYVMALCALRSLTDSKEAYYDRYRFAEIFAYAKRVPNAVRHRLAEIPGIARLQTRIVVDVTLSLPHVPEPPKGRIISVPDNKMPQLNSVHLRKGRWVEPYAADEVMLSESFAEAHRLEIGDGLSAIINGRLQELKIVGIVLSPEYIIQIPPGALLPDDRQFGVMWMSQYQLEAAYDMKGAFNNVCVRRLRSANEQEVIERIDDILRPYGCQGAYGRKSHISHQFISDEIRQLRATAIIAPSLFLSVSAYLLNMVLSRIIGLQREQIAALKAFGYTNFQVGLHYLKMVLVIALVGTAIGSIGGVFLGKWMTAMYARFYRFPILLFRFEGSTVVASVVISMAAATIGTVSALRRAAKLPPAQAMRPEPPARYRPTMVERLGIGAIVPQTLRMILRRLERNPLKSILGVLGISMAVAVLILGSFTLDAVTYIMDFQFRVAQRQDMTVTFFEPGSHSTIHDFEHLDGVLRCEAFRNVACRLRNGPRSRRVGLMGLQTDSTLYRVFDRQEEQAPIPPEGLMLSDKLASLLDLRLGDLVRVEVLEGKRGVYNVPVVAIAREFSGTSAYMNLEALNRLLQEGRTITGTFLMVDPDRRKKIYQALKQAPRVAGITVKSQMLESFTKTVAENLLTIRLFNMAFASVIAFGVVYNSARISLSEQSRELATLRVIGFTRLEASSILLGEIATLTLVAIPFGCVMGYGFAWMATLGLDTEIYRIPLIVNFSTFAYASLTVVVATLVSGLIVRRKIDQLDLVSVLKSKE